MTFKQADDRSCQMVVFFNSQARVRNILRTRLAWIKQIYVVESKIE